MNADSDQLVKIARATTGIPITRIPQATQELIDHDRFHRLQVSRAKPVSESAVTSRAATAGEGFICDGFGKHDAGRAGARGGAGNPAHPGPRAGQWRCVRATGW